MGPAGLYYIDGMDLWTVFGMFVEKGTDDFLKFAARKESISHDWINENGIDVDDSRVFLKDRDITLHVAFIVDGPEQFWTKYNAFLAQMMLPGKRRIEPKGLGDVQYFCHYKESGSAVRFTKYLPDAAKIAVKFTITFTEVNPADNITQVVFIVDEDGRFLVT